MLLATTLTVLSSFVSSAQLVIRQLTTMGAISIELIAETMKTMETINLTILMIVWNVLSWELEMGACLHKLLKNISLMS